VEQKKERKKKHRKITVSLKNFFSSFPFSSLYFQSLMRSVLEVEIELGVHVLCGDSLEISQLPQQDLSGVLELVVPVKPVNIRVHSRLDIQIPRSHGVTIHEEDCCQGGFIILTKANGLLTHVPLLALLPPPAAAAPPHSVWRCPPGAMPNERMSKKFTYNRTVSRRPKNTRTFGSRSAAAAAAGRATAAAGDREEAPSFCPFHHTTIIFSDFHSLTVLQNKGGREFSRSTHTPSARVMVPYSFPCACRVSKCDLSSVNFILEVFFFWQTSSWSWERLTGHPV